MAGIETLTGVAKINAFEYEVTSEVSVGASIDDLEYATFVQKSGGLLKFDSGCTTTFTNCKFVEETDAASAPQNKRFIANSSTSPVFKGCKFIVVHPFGTARGNSDFDVPTGANPTFDFSEDGSPCYFVRNNSGDIAEANHYYSGTFNSFVVDQNGGGGAFEVMSPSLTINDLTLKDRGLSNPLGSRHLIIYTSRSAFYNNTTTFRKLKSDNVSLFGGANTTDNNIIIKVIDAKGELLRSEDTENSQRGYLQFLRTYQSAPLDATTLSAVSVKGYLKNTDNNDIIINGTTSGIDEELLQYKYEHNTTSTKEVITRDANGDPQTTGTFFTVANNYIRGFISYDRLPTSRTFKIEDRADGSPLVHDVVLVDDSSITGTYASAKALTEITDANKFYDRAKAYLVDNYTGEIATIVSRNENTIDMGSYDLDIDSNASAVFAFDGSKITIKASSFTGNLTTTSGTITVQSGVTVLGTITDVNNPAGLSSRTFSVSNVILGATIQIYNENQVTKRGTTEGYTPTNVYETLIASGTTTDSTLIGDGSSTIAQLISAQSLTADPMADTSYVLPSGWTLTTTEVVGDNNRVTISGIYDEGTSPDGDFNVGDSVRIRATCAAAAGAFLPFVNTTIANESGFSIRVNQQADTIYNDNAIDGSAANYDTATLTLTPDYTNLQIDVLDSDTTGVVTVQQIYAKYAYLITTTQGIEKFFGAITAENTSNYRINTDVVDLKIQNISANDTILTGARLYRSDNTTVLAKGYLNNDEAQGLAGTISHDTGEFLQYIQPQVEAALNGYGVAGTADTDAIKSDTAAIKTDTEAVKKKTNLIPGLL
jgi:hypothetical protein